MRLLGFKRAGHNHQSATKMTTEDGIKSTVNSIEEAKVCWGQLKKCINTSITDLNRQLRARATRASKQNPSGPRPSKQIKTGAEVDEAKCDTTGRPDWEITKLPVASHKSFIIHDNDAAVAKVDVNFDEAWMVASSDTLKEKLDTEPLKTTLKAFSTAAMKHADVKACGCTNAPMIKGAGEKLSGMVFESFGPGKSQLISVPESASPMLRSAGTVQWISAFSGKACSVDSETLHMASMYLIVSGSMFFVQASFKEWIEWLATQSARNPDAITYSQAVGCFKKAKFTNSGSTFQVATCVAGAGAIVWIPAGSLVCSYIVNSVKAVALRKTYIVPTEKAVAEWHAWQVAYKAGEGKVAHKQAEVETLDETLKLFEIRGEAPPQLSIVPPIVQQSDVLTAEKEKAAEKTEVQAAELSEVEVANKSELCRRPSSSELEDAEKPI